MCTPASAPLEPGFTALCRDHRKLEKTNPLKHLGTLGTGNHCIEVCLDEARFVWFMLHSGSRGVGNFIGTLFIELAKQDALRNHANLSARDLADFEEGSRHFGDHVRAVGWAQRFAATNRDVMMKRVVEAAKAVIHKDLQSHIEAVNCHHSCVSRKDQGVIEETPAACKDIDAVMADQRDLVEVVHTLKQVVCGKGQGPGAAQARAGAGIDRAGGSAARNGAPRVALKSSAQRPHARDDDAGPTRR